MNHTVHSSDIKPEKHDKESLTVPIVILNLNKPEENKSISIEKTHNNQQKIILKKEVINEIDKNEIDKNEIDKYEIDKNTDKFHFSDISPSFDFSLVHSR